MSTPCYELPTPLDVTQAAACRQVLLEALSADCRPVIKLSGVTGVDAAILQLLLAANEDAQQAGGRLQLNDVTPELAERLYQVGAGHLLEATLSPCKSNADSVNEQSV